MCLVISGLINFVRISRGSSIVMLLIWLKWISVMWVLVMNRICSMKIVIDMCLRKVNVLVSCWLNVFVMLIIVKVLSMVVVVVGKC